MANGAGAWVGLFSGGKDSSWAVHQALERGLDVHRLVTVHPGEGSYMYHVPETGLTTLAARSIGIPLVEVSTPDGMVDGPVDADDQGDREIGYLEAELRELDEELPGGVAGIIAGAVESEYQTSRIEAMCDRLNVDLFAPLWQRKPRAAIDEMLHAGFEITIVQVAAAGLDESWLGRSLDADAVEELERLNAEYGVHLLGEGGEFETVVTNGPHMNDRIDLEFETEWDGTRGRIRVTDARLC